VRKGEVGPLAGLACWQLLATGYKIKPTCCCCCYVTNPSTTCSTMALLHVAVLPNPSLISLSRLCSPCAHSRARSRMLIAHSHVQVRLGKEVRGSQDDAIMDSTEPEFYQCFCLPCTLPGTSQLEVECWDYDRFSSNDLVSDKVYWYQPQYRTAGTYTVGRITGRHTDRHTVSTQQGHSGHAVGTVYTRHTVWAQRAR
jgi:hypothetical protein